MADRNYLIQYGKQTFSDLPEEEIVQGADKLVAAFPEDTNEQAISRINEAMKSQAAVDTDSKPVINTQMAAPVIRGNYGTTPSLENSGPSLLESVSSGMTGYQDKLRADKGIAPMKQPVSVPTQVATPVKPTTPEIIPAKPVKAAVPKQVDAAVIQKLEQVPPEVKKQAVTEYIMGKYAAGDRQKLVDDLNNQASDFNWAALLAGVGSAYAGRGASGADDVIRLQQASRDNTLKQFDNLRDKAIQDMDLKEKADLRVREEDPNSAESELARQLASKMFKTKDFSGMTAAQLNKQLPTLQKLYDIDQRNQDRSEVRAERAEAKKLAADKLKTTQGKMDNLNASQKARFDNARMGRSAVADMKNALEAGDNTFSVIGDNNYTESQRRFEEALGRMQSGGAITNDEAARFKAMSPKVTDSAEMQKRKLKQLEDEMDSRLSTLGFEPEELGFGSGSKSNGKITVTNGSETLEIDESDLSDAEQDGYRRV